MEKTKHLKLMKKLLGSIALATLASIAIAAPRLDSLNDDLKISNSSNNLLTFIFDHGHSNQVINVQPHSIQVIPRGVLNHLCEANPFKCESQVYASSSSRYLAAIIFDLSYGVQSLTVFGGDYKVGGSGFNLFFDGPWVK